VLNPTGESTFPTQVIPEVSGVSPDVMAQTFYLYLS